MPDQSLISNLVDSAHLTVEKSTIDYREVVQLDHHRMAKNDDAYTPPAIVNVFSDYSDIISNLIKKDQLIGIDMPFKLLAYSEPKAIEASYAYTSAEFIQKRHGLQPEDLADYKKVIDHVVAKLPQNFISKTDVSSIENGFGIIKLKSDYDFNSTILNIRALARGNKDTRWFAEIDFQKEVLKYSDDKINPTMLCMFGVPDIGAKAMYNAPKIGLDAFCQKVLVYELDNGDVYVAFNDIVSFGELYYGESNAGQHFVSKTMTISLKRAISKLLKR